MSTSEWLPPITLIGPNITADMQPTTVKLGPWMSIMYPTLFTPEQRDQLSRSALDYIASRAGFSPAYPVADQFRQALVKFLDLPPGTVLNMGYLEQKYIGLAVFAGILILLGLIMWGLGIWFCCVLSPRATSGKSKAGKFGKVDGWKQKPFNWKMFIPMVLALILLAFLIWGIICVFRGTLQMDDELKLAVKAVNEILLLVQFKIAAVPVTLKALAVNTNATIVHAMDFTTDIVTSPVVTDKINTLQKDMQTLLNQITPNRDPFQNLTAEVSSLAAQLNAAALRVIDLTNQINNVDVDGQKAPLKPEFQIPGIDGSRAQRIVDLTNQIQTSLADANSDLYKALNKTQSIATALAKGNWTEIYGDAVNSASQRALDIIGGYTQLAVDKALALYQDSLAKVLAASNEAEQQFYNLISLLNKLEVPRNVLTILLECFVILFIIVVAAAIVWRKPALLANCTMAAVALVVISFILAGVYLIVAAAINETCYYLEQERWEVLLPTINSLAHTDIKDFQISALLDARRSCAEGIGAVQVAIQLLGPGGLALVNNETIKELFAFTTELNQTLHEKADQIKTEIVLAAQQIPPKVDETLGNVADDVRKVAAKLRQVQSQIDPLLANLQSNVKVQEIKDKVNALLQAADAAFLDDVPAVVRKAAVAKVQKLAQDLLTQLDALQTAQNAFNGTSAKLETAVVKLDAGLTVLVSQLEQLANKLDDLTQVLVDVSKQVVDKVADRAVPAILNGTNLVLDVVGKALIDLVGCKWIVQDTFIAQYALCVGVGRAVDSQWFGLFLQALTLTLLIPCLLWLAKTWWNVDPTKWSWRGDVEKKALSGDLEKDMDKDMDVKGMPMDTAKMVEVDPKMQEMMEKNMYTTATVVTDPNTSTTTIYAPAEPLSPQVLSPGATSTPTVVTNGLPPMPSISSTPMLQTPQFTSPLDPSVIVKQP